MHARTLVAGLVILVGSSQVSWAQLKACPQPMADVAEAAADQFTDWHQVASYMKRFHACDEGSIQEGSSASVGQLLADHWKMLPQLAMEIHKQPELRNFVLAHINTTLNTADIDKIAHQAKTNCSATNKILCKQIAGAARNALRFP